MTSDGLAAKGLNKCSWSATYCSSGVDGKQFQQRDRKGKQHSKIEKTHRGGASLGFNFVPCRSVHEKVTDKDLGFNFVPFRSVDERYKIWDAFSRVVADNGSIYVFGPANQMGNIGCKDILAMSLD